MFGLGHDELFPFGNWGHVCMWKLNKKERKSTWTNFLISDELLFFHSIVINLDTIVKFNENSDWNHASIWYLENQISPVYSKISHKTIILIVLLLGSLMTSVSASRGISECESFYSSFIWC